MQMIRARAKARPGPGPELELQTLHRPVDVLCRWAHDVLRVPTGPLRGKPFVIYDWQRDFLREAMADGVREAGLSVARKNGKSGLIAAYLLAHLDGPLVRPQWRAAVVSLTGELAKELRHAMEATANISNLDIAIYQSPTPGRIEGKRGTRVDFLAADKSAGHAIGCDVALIDECGLLDERKRGLYNAMLSSVSGRDGRLVAISIRGDGPMFSEIADRKANPAVVWNEYAADPDGRIDDPAQWRKANPALGVLKSEQYMHDACQRAMAAPSNQASFLAHDMNRPQAPDSQPLINADDWRRCEVETLPERKGPCAWGVDLGSGAAMSAVSAYWPESGRLECLAAFPTIPNLKERGAADGVGGMYTDIARRGELLTLGDRIVPVRDLLLRALAQFGPPAVIAADRWREAELLEAVENLGVGCQFSPRGQGWKDGAEDVRTFRAACLEGKVSAPVSLLLRGALSEATVVADAAGNVKLAKGSQGGRRQRARDDAAAAAILAVAEGVRRHSQFQRPGWRSLGVIRG